MFYAVSINNANSRLHVKIMQPQVFKNLALTLSPKSLTSVYYWSNSKLQNLYSAS